MRDKNFRIEIAEDGIHLYNRDGHHIAQDAFELYPKLDVDKDGAHAFYLGAELARAEIAWRLAKRYAQDEPLDWGVAADAPADDKTKAQRGRPHADRQEEAPGLVSRRVGAEHAMPMIRETIVTTLNPEGKVHIAPLGLIAEPSGPRATAGSSRRSGRPPRSTICAPILTRWRTSPTTC